MRNFFLLILWLTTILNESYAQHTSSEDNWRILSKVTFEKKKTEYGEDFFPNFSEQIRKCEGKKMLLKGYIVPFDDMFSPNKLILSSLPVASCFFCGGGGPETIVQVYLSSETKYMADQIIIEGTFELNDKDPDQLMYLIKDARMIAR